MSGIARSVTVRLSANVGDYIAKMNSAGAATSAAMGRADRSVVGHSKGLALLGKGALIGGAAVATGLGYAVKVAADFDQSMSKVEAATGKGGAGLKALREAAIQAGADTAFSASEAAGGIENLAKAGVSSQNILGGGLRGALDLAAAGGLGVADAAEIAATALTQFKLKGADIPHVADLLAAGAGKAQGEVSDLAAALNQAGLVAAGSGLSIEETTGTLAAFASAGLTGSDAGTSFKTMLQRLQAPVGAGAKEMERLNVSAYDAQGNFIGMSAVASQLRDRLKGMKSEQRDAALATIFGSDAVRAARVLYEQGGRGIDKWTKAVDDQGFAAKTAATRMNNLKGDVEQLGGSFETALIKLGSGAQSPLRGVVQDITGEINRLSKNGTLDEWGVNVAASIGDVIDVAKEFGPVVGSALSTAASTAKTLAGAFGSLPSGLQKALVTGAVVGAAAKKVGATSLIGAATKTVGAGLGGRGVTPVFVTNMGATGLDGAAGGKGSKLGGIVKGGVTAAGGAAAVGTLAAIVGGLTVVAAAAKKLGDSVEASTGKKVTPDSKNPARFTEQAYAGGLKAATPGQFDAKALHDAKSALVDIGKQFDVSTDKGIGFFGLAKQYQGLDTFLRDMADSNPGKAWSTLKDAAEDAGAPVGALLDKLPQTASALRKVGAANQEAAANFNAFATNAAAAGVSTGELKSGLSTLPSYVRTQILTPGAVESKADVTALAKQFGLTPRQVKTIMQLIGAEKVGEKTRKTRQQLADFNNTKYKPKIDVQDSATPKLKVSAAAAKRFARPYQAELRAIDRASKMSEQAKTRARAFATGKYIAKIGANAAGALTGAAKAKGAINGVKDKKTKIDVNTNAPAAAATARRVMNVPDTSATIRITTLRVEKVSREITSVAAGLFGGPKKADGGSVIGPGTGTSDSIPAMLSNNEHVWTAREVAAAGGHAAVAALRSAALGGKPVRLAGGGPVQTYARGGSVNSAILNAGSNQLASIRDAVQDATRTVRENEKNQKKMRGESKGEHKKRLAAMGKATRELERNTSKLTDLRDRRNEYSKGVGEAFVEDPFASTLGGFRNQTSRESKQLAGVRDDLTTLDRRGLNGALYKDLAASGNAALIDQFSKLSRSQLNVEEARYNRRNRLTRVVGNQAANEVYSGALRNLTREVRGLEKELKLLRRGKHIGNHVTNFNGNMRAKDSDALVNKWDARQKQAARLAAHR